MTTSESGHIARPLDIVHPRAAWNLWRGWHAAGDAGDGRRRLRGLRRAGRGARHGQREGQDGLPRRRPAGRRLARRAPRTRSSATSQAVLAASRRAFPIPSSSSPPTSGRASAWARRTTREELRARWLTALEYDSKALSSQASTAASWSAACWATTSPSPASSARSSPSSEFYDYRAKYLDNASRLTIPARDPTGDGGGDPAHGGGGVPRARPVRAGAGGLLPR